VKIVKLVPAKCPSCGADIEVNKDLEKTICQYCGTTVLIEDAIQKLKIELSGKIEVDGVTSQNKLLKNAETKMKLGKYNEGFKDYKKYFSQYPDDYNGYLSYLHIVMYDKEFQKNNSFEYQDLLTMEIYEKKAFYKTAPKNEIDKFNEEFNQFLRDNEEDIPKPYQLFRFKSEFELKIECDYNEYYRKKFQIECDKVKILNSYFYIHILYAFKDAYLTLVFSDYYNEYIFDRKKLLFKDKDTNSRIVAGKNSLCKTNLFGKNIVDDFSETICLLRDMNIFAIDDKGRPVFIAYNNSDYIKLGVINGIDLNNISKDELENMLKVYEKKEIAENRAQKLNDISRNTFKSFDQLLNLSLKDDNSNIYSLYYIFNDGIVVCLGKAFYNNYKIPKESSIFKLKNYSFINKL
jgi:hypothetical protein